MSSKWNNTVLVIFIALKFILQFSLVNPQYDLHRDEYLHLDQGQHLAWGYISVPPFTSWISYLIALLGNSPFWVRFFPALFGAGTMVLVCKSIEALKGGRFAFLCGGMAVLLSVLLRMNMLYQPNSFDIFFWTLTYFSLIKLISTGNTKWFLLTGTAIGLGFLSKYNILFLLAGMFPALLLTAHRKLLLSKYFFIGLMLGSLIIFPNILWQVNHRFPTIKQLQELADTQLVNVQRVNFIIDQVVYFSGVLILVIGALVALVAFPLFKPYRLFAWSYFFTLALFIVFKAKSYYAIGLYPVLFVFGSIYIERISLDRKWLRLLTIVYIVSFSLPFIYFTFPIKSAEYYASNPGLSRSLGLLRWEDGKEHRLQQDFADMLGWRELAQITDSVYFRLQHKGRVMVLCDSYGQAGAINYYSKFKDINAVAFNADYLHWMSLERKIDHIILVQSADDDDPHREKEKPWFRKVSVAGKVQNEYARERGTTVYVLEDARIDINAVLQSEVDKRRY